MAEHGFFHPDRGYWQANDDVPNDILEGYPEGTVEIPIKPSRFHEWADGEWVHRPPPDPTPEEIRAKMRPLTARQFRLGLIEGGVSLDRVTAVIDALPAGADRAKAKVEWEYATTFNRTHPLIATVGAALGLSDVQIDAMWQAAVSL